MTLNKRESHYENQIKELQTKRDQAIRESQDIRNELNKLQEDKTSIEKQLNETINSLKQDFEKQIQSFQTQITELENQSLCLSLLSSNILFLCFIDRTITNQLSEKDEQLKDSQSKFDQLIKENTDLRQQLDHQRQENELKSMLA